MTPNGPRLDGPSVGCGAAILRDGKLLLVKRLKPPEAGAWSLVGGKVDFLEPIETAILREAREEIGVEIALAGLLCVVETIGVDGQHWVSLVHRARLVAGEPSNCEPHKHAELGWFALDAPPEPLSAAARQALAALAAG
ncbi:MAG: NUDIX domain-containing protein [Bradyrhizobium sp.]|nr:MAG: NUDIX domain-containing protein [Bradyrhizobium sp.]